MTAARVLDAADVRAGTPWRQLMGAIATIVASDTAVQPERHVHDLDLGDHGVGSLLLMPSWVPREAVGVKAITYVPTNAGTSTPTINAAYLLFDGADGRLLAVLDGDELTARRTAATSALAADRLARTDARRLLVVGTGQLAPRMAEAHAQVRDLERIEVWGRDPQAAADVATSLVGLGLPARPSEDLAASVREADIISTVTGATNPLVHGADLRPGAHLDLVGSFRRDMREADDEAVRRASVFVDTRPGALASGDLALPLEAGAITEAAILADLADLVRGSHPGRPDDDEITLFKSAGFALADLAAARLALQVSGPQAG